MGIVKVNKKTQPKGGCGLLVIYYLVLTRKRCHPHSKF